LSQIKLLVGLGNPESQYGSTRHNAGFWLLNLLAEQHNLVWKADQKFKAEITTLYSSNSGIEKFWLMKPSLYMNESGTSVSSFCFFYKIKAEEVLIVHDELDLKPGMLRMKKGGSNAGHRGIKDIQKKLGVGDFWRLRLGIGHPRTAESHIKDVSDYVLSKPSESDKINIDRVINACQKNILNLLNCDINDVQNDLNKET